jgi:bifunctional non-homologous end joining protein LigD
MSRAAADPLQRYRAKRDFEQTPEPPPARAAARAGRPLSFVIQKHDATRLHYDFRLELDGVLLSWAVPKGPSFDPADKRMAVRTEDHPLSYGGFEGRIPAGQYGAGTVILWDRGTWHPLGDPHAGLAAGKLAFDLAGAKLRGRWELVRMKAAAGNGRETWLLFKKRDPDARPRSEYDVVAALPDSVVNAKTTAAVPAPAAALPPVGPPPGGVKAAMPSSLSPQLAKLAAAVPKDGDWIFEVKFDGYRVLTRIARGEPKMITRGGGDWTARMPALAQALRDLGLQSAWLDGEIVVRGAQGQADFNALQNAFDTRRTQAIVYQLFDLPYCEGQDLRNEPLHARRELLRRLLEARGGPLLQFSAALPGDATQALQAACKAQLEGVMAKRRDAPYRSTRSDSWLKLKCRQRQEFVIGGYTQRSDGSAEVGSLLLGVHDAQGELRHAGRVGTGWSRPAARELYVQLQALAAKASPFAQDAKRRSTAGPSGARWVRPTLVAEVQFAEWTPAGQVRQASFVSLRSDKPAREITREVVAEPSSKSTSKAKAPSGAASSSASRSSTPAPLPLTVTHPERVIDAESGLTKLDVVRYYDSVADWMLPHLKGRPAGLLRGPSGVGGELFFQRHSQRARIDGVRELDPALWPGHAALLEVPNRRALLAAAQMNVIEFHTWNASAARIDRPDRMVFDLDPGEGVAWTAVREGAGLVRALLDELGLQSWLKTSGSKGLHLVVPIATHWPHELVKDFSQAIVQHLAQTMPARFVAQSGAKRRVGKIFVDYLRNGLGATTVAAYSARARPGLGVSMPLAWDALDDLRSSAQWTIATAHEHLSQRHEDPWAGYATARQSLSAPMKRLGLAQKPGQRPT